MLHPMFAFAPNPAPWALQKQVSIPNLQGPSRSPAFRSRRLSLPLKRPLSATTMKAMEPTAEISRTSPTTSEEEITLLAEDGSHFISFLATPAILPDTPSTSAVLLMSDILGCENNDTRGVAKRLATAGFPTIVPDLFRGKPWTAGRSMSEYEMWRGQHDLRRVSSDLKVAREYLLNRGFGQDLGLLGFCFGGGRLMDEVALSTTGLNPKTAVAFYPTRFDPVSSGKNASCPILLITGDQDELVPMSVVTTFEETIKQNGKVTDYIVDIYKGYGHAFAHHPRNDDESVQAEKALNKAVGWFRSTL